MRRTLDAPQTQIPVKPSVRTRSRVLDKTNLLRSLEVKTLIQKDDYESRLESLQGRLNLLTRKKKFRDLGVVAVFEG